MDNTNDAQQLEGYRRLIDITRDLASTLDLDTLLDRIIHAAKDITSAGAASILLYDPVGRQLHFQVATNMDDSMMRGIEVPLEGSIAGWILTHKETVRTSDARTDMRYFRNVSDQTGYETQSLLGVPLATKDKVVGVLEVVNKDTGEFTEQDEDLLKVLASQAAVAIENTRLFQQSDLISEFVHELRTPLAAISTATYLLLRPEISQEQSQQIVNSVHNEALRLSTMASSFLDVARLESGRVQFHKSRFELKKLIEDCTLIMNPKAAESHVQIRLDIPDNLQIEADRDKFKQIFINLLSNAIKYNRPGGLVTINAYAYDKATIIKVSDTGLGIPEKDLPHLFEKFFRVKDTEGKVSGTGLGLSIVKQIVLGHGGKIDVESTLGEGTTFTIRLPKK